MAEFAADVTIADPGPRFAADAKGQCIVEDDWSPPSRAFDLCIAVGTLDSVNDLPRALHILRASLIPDSLLIGAVSGGETLPRLRQAMRAGDQLMGASSPHVHPRLEGPTLAALLDAAGFIMPVVDVDRVQVSYRSFDGLVGDLRRMASTNILCGRSLRTLNRAAKAAAIENFAAAGDGSRTIELFEILHFAAWTAPPDVHAHQG